MERVKPRLQHANSAVVLSATKVIIRFLDVLTDSDKVSIYLWSSRSFLNEEFRVSNSYGDYERDCAVPKMFAILLICILNGTDQDVPEELGAASRDAHVG